ncbi:hypothetical protein UFOVP653_54 [uncultured Caudovirales phage]|uniref:Major tropism determinant N-terminal domain-containing protein n=1 Tax=uncultured Caudovirales phage TaxID=2100421 RepID=A0A6J5N7E6_9CAUD|nr:hypothetical protein UFOVP653_54 [uncultured Caudovirales phage]
MSVIVTRLGKGSALTYEEVDANFTNLNNDKYQVGGALGTPVSGDLSNCTNAPLSSAAGILSIEKGGTGQSTTAQAFDALAPSTTAGDLIYRGVSSNLRLPAGTGVLVGGSVPSYSTAPTISGTNFNNVPNAALVNSTITLGATIVGLGETTPSISGLTSITLTQDPTAPLQAATKQYVDAVAEGLHVHAACACATTGTLASITGGTVTYNNGTAGVGATLTLSVALTTLDGYTLQNGNRILVKNEATQANNGIYTWATGGTVLTRATDFNTAAEIASGDFTFVTYGTAYANSGWVQTTVMVTVGTTPVTFVQFAGAGTYTAGTGLTLTGTQFSLTSPVAATLGGTGLSSATTGDIIYAAATNTWGRLAAVSTGNVLISNGVGTAPSYGKVNLLNAVSGTLNVGNGGTGFTSYTAGDLIYAGTPTTLSKLGIGLPNTVLTSSGGSPQWSNTLSLTGLTVTNDVTISGLKIGRGTNGYTTNTVVGRSAFGSATAGQYNTVFGLSALAASTGSYNIAIGASSMETASGGDNNVGVGNSTLKVTISGGQNSAFGTEALNAVTSGSSNVAVGERAGVTIGSIFAVTTGSNNTFIGTRAGFASATQRNYATAIGSEAKVQSDNTVVLGRTTDTTVIGATGKAGYGGKLQVTGNIEALSGLVSAAVFQNPTLIQNNLTLSASHNGLSVGPVQIDNGVSFTVPTGQRWVVM